MPTSDPILVASGSLLGRWRRGFTLVEILIVVVILGILAALVFPQYQALSREARAKSQASNVRKVREMVQIHRNSGEYTLNAAGVPTQISAGWFKGGELPEHSWTQAPMVITNAAAGPLSVYPATKTFDPSVAGAANAWYNTSNGRFCSLVPDQVSPAETLALFNLANSAEATSLAQTTQ